MSSNKTDRYYIYITDIQKLGIDIVYNIIKKKNESINDKEFLIRAFTNKRHYIFFSVGDKTFTHADDLSHIPEMIQYNYKPLELPIEPMIGGELI